jgi:hypothetical protein
MSLVRYQAPYSRFDIKKIVRGPLKLKLSEAKTEIENSIDPELSSGPGSG